jgi:hypothetical protein
VDTCKDHSNPFLSNRAEQMGGDLWKYYVEAPFGNLLGSKPLVMEGGRGCGKYKRRATCGNIL